MASEPKRRKIKQPPTRRIITSPTGKEHRADKSVAAAQIGNTNLSIQVQQARNFAIAQAQQDGCIRNFRIFDSPFRNYFVLLFQPGRT